MSGIPYPDDYDTNKTSFSMCVHYTLCANKTMETYTPTFGEDVSLDIKDTECTASVHKGSL